MNPRHGLVSILKQVARATMTPVGIIEKKYSLITTPLNDMMQRSRGFYAGFSRHVSRASNKSEFVNRKYEERP
jgi:hypothetical protein